MRWKLLATAIFAIATGNAAHAAIAVDKDASFGELFLAVWDKVGTSSAGTGGDIDQNNTYLLDLGVNVLTNDWSQKFSASVGSNYASAFPGTDPANLVYTLVGGVRSQTGVQPVFGSVFFTSSPSFDVSSAAMSLSNLGANLVNLNNLAAAQQPGTDYATNTDSKAISGAGSIGTLPGQAFNGNLVNGTSPIQTFGAIGQSLGLYQIGYYGSGTISIKDALGTFLFDGQTVAYTGAPVPLPAGIWLLGSALLGLVGISRRRTAPAI